MNRKLDRPCEATPPVDVNRKRIDTHVDNRPVMAKNANHADTYRIRAQLRHVNGARPYVW